MCMSIPMSYDLYYRSPLQVNSPGNVAYIIVPYLLSMLESDVIEVIM